MSKNYFDKIILINTITNEKHDIGRNILTNDWYKNNPVLRTIKFEDYETELLPYLVEYNKIKTPKYCSIFKLELLKFLKGINDTFIIEISYEDSLL